VPMRGRMCCARPDQTLPNELIMPGDLATTIAAPAADPPAADHTEKGRSRIVGLVRAIPIRWRILSIAALNSAVVLVLAALI